MHITTIHMSQEKKKKTLCFNVHIPLFYMLGPDLHNQDCYTTIWNLWKILSTLFCYVPLHVCVCVCMCVHVASDDWIIYNIWLVGASLWNRHVNCLPFDHLPHHLCWLSLMQTIFVFYAWMWCLRQSNYHSWTNAFSFLTL